MHWHGLAHPEDESRLGWEAGRGSGRAVHKSKGKYTTLTYTTLVGGGRPKPLQTGGERAGLYIRTMESLSLYISLMKMYVFWYFSLNASYQCAPTRLVYKETGPLLAMH